MKVTTFEDGSTLQLQRVARLATALVLAFPVALSLALRSRIRGTSSPTVLAAVFLGSIFFFGIVESSRVARRRRLASNTEGRTVVVHGVFDELRSFLGLDGLELEARRKHGAAFSKPRDILVELDADPARFSLLSMTSAKLFGIDAPDDLDEVAIGFSNRRAVTVTLHRRGRELVLEGKGAAPVVSE